MARYLLDTNILVYVLLSEFDNLSNDSKIILNDYDNLLFTSSLSVMEILQLLRIKKIKAKKYQTPTELFSAIEKEFYIKIVPFAKEHVQTLARLQIPADHNDPFDHAIIAQAMSEKMTLVSSDKKFKEYAPQQLRLAFNRR
ncbi:MAG: toxin PIN [Flavobacterium sp. BFFFF2]|nr:MAG: toxin PIN [Flavobacterium sp. BFFFF2]